MEDTVNPDTQTAGVTKGFSLKRAAVERYYLTSEYYICIRAGQKNGGTRNDPPQPPRPAQA